MRVNRMFKAGLGGMAPRGPLLGAVADEQVIPNRDAPGRNAAGTRHRTREFGVTPQEGRVKIELLYVPGCPNVNTARDLLRACLQELGLDVLIEER